MTALTSYLKEEASAIALSSKRLSNREVEKSLEVLSNCYKNRGKVVVTGVGKSGIVGRKIAATFSSIGLMSIYLNPLDALHGDIGILSENDVTLILSNSGETQEIVKMIPHIKRRESKIIGILGNKKSKLANYCYANLDGSVDKESCPLNIIPTASTAVAMAIGDALAAVLIERNAISTEDFAINHPAGSLGKKLTLTVADLLIKNRITSGLEINATIQNIISRITQDGMGVTWIYENANAKNELKGIITDGDIRRAFKDLPPENWKKLKAIDLMTKDPITIFSEELAIDALMKMELNKKKPITVMPVLNKKDNSFVGLIRLHDLIQAGIN